MKEEVKHTKWSSSLDCRRTLISVNIGGFLPMYRCWTLACFCISMEKARTMQKIRGSHLLQPWKLLCNLAKSLKYKFDISGYQNYNDGIKKQFKSNVVLERELFVPYILVIFHQSVRITSILWLYAIGYP